MKTRILSESQNARGGRSRCWRNHDLVQDDSHARDDFADNPDPLAWVELPDPQPGPREVRIRVSVCGVCHTELDEIEGRASPSELPRILGHEVVGVIVDVGDCVESSIIGRRVGVAWVFSACGDCDYCRRGLENLCPDFRGSGRDANGGYAELIIAPRSFVHEIPEALPDPLVAPLLCAGVIGHRSLKLANLENGAGLGLTGFGASGHLVLRLARYLYPDSPVYVFARSERERRFALELGATWVGDTTDTAPSDLRAFIDTTPAWTPIAEGLGRSEPGGGLVIHAIRKQKEDQRVLANLTYAKGIPSGFLWATRVHARRLRARVEISFEFALKFPYYPLMNTVGIVTTWLISLSVGLCAAERPSSVANHYPGDRGIETDPRVILSTDFETDDWKDSWSGGERKTVSIVEPLKVDALHSLSNRVLRIDTPEGEHYGATLQFDFQDALGHEPEEIYFRYYIRLGAGWDPELGGKFPGIGGTYGRAGWGGRPSDGRNGWSARGLFKGRREERTEIGFYCYHADMTGTYGSEWVWRNEKFKGLENSRWYCIEQYVKMNTPGDRDGILRGWVDGDLIFEKSDVRMRDTPDLKIETIWVNIYHGGSWTAASDSFVLVDNIVIGSEYIGPLRP